jgi:5'-3' exonuclease
MFDEHLPPLWSDVVTHLRQQDGSTVAAPPVVYKDPLPDWLHLFSVLPAASVQRLLPPHVQRLMATMPWYWPETWSVFDVGKTQMWECEPVIPIIPEVVLRKLDK